jgi:predicted enzyme related to lactoylglutathione lyase
MNELLWITLQVADLERARAFWRDAVGLRERSFAPGWVELELRPDVLLALHPVFHANALVKRGYDRGGAVLGVRVMDIEQMGYLLEREGAKALSSIHAIPGGRARDFEDPEGYVFELVQLDAPGGS